MPRQFLCPFFHGILCSMSPQCCEETKLTKGVYTHWSSGYNIQSTHALSKWQGGISLFWRTSEMYEIKEVELRGPNVLSFQLMSGATRWYIVGCYILPTNLPTLAHIEQA
jgi:hypothetical protein